MKKIVVKLVISAGYFALSVLILMQSGGVAH